MIAAHRDSIQIADSDADVLKIVQNAPGAVGLVDVRAVDATINVVCVDGKLPMECRVSAPLTADLRAGGGSVPHTEYISEAKRLRQRVSHRPAYFMPSTK